MPGKHIGGISTNFESRPTFEELYESIPEYVVEETGVEHVEFFAKLEGAAVIGHWSDAKKCAVCRAKLTGQVALFIAGDLHLSYTVNIQNIRSALYQNFVWNAVVPE